MIEHPAHITLEHIRDPNFREVMADGCLSKVMNGYVVITFYQEENLVQSETFELVDAAIGAYGPTGVQETARRLQLIAVRLPIDQLMSLATSVAQKANPDFVPPVQQ